MTVPGDATTGERVYRTAALYDGRTTPSRSYACSDLTEVEELHASLMSVGGTMNAWVEVAEWRRLDSPEPRAVRLSIADARYVFELLGHADQRKAFGKCGDHPTGDGYCRICTLLDSLQMAIWEAEDRAALDVPDPAIPGDTTGDSDV